MAIVVRLESEFGKVIRQVIDEGQATARALDQVFESGVEKQFTVVR